MALGNLIQNKKIIVIEGLDGSGKATQAEILTQYFIDQGKDVKQISFPNYANKSSTLVSMYLAGDIGAVNDVNPYAASSFYASDRYISYVTSWKNEYLQGHTIIADRYTTSNIPFQMVKLPKLEWDEYLEWLADYEYDRIKLPRPNIVIYLDVPPDISRRLLGIRYHGDETKKDIHESNFEYLMSCREGALYAAERLGWKVINCCGDGEMLPPEVIAEMIKDVLDNESQDSQGGFNECETLSGS